MGDLNLDITTNQYLDIINENILEPYLIEKNYTKPSTDEKVGMFDDKADVWFFTGTGGSPATYQLATDKLLTGYDDTDDTSAILKIPQHSGNKTATIINTVRTTAIDSVSRTKINDEKLHTDIDSDENGFIYYNASGIKLYNLDKFKNSDYNTEDTIIANDDYYDFFVRYKILKYIKDTHLSAKNTTLRATVIAKLEKNKPIVEKGITSNITTLKIGKMLDLLQFINNNKFDKFEPLVNCLYYYYWMALVNYNQTYCAKQLAYFNFTSFRSGGDAHTAISKLDGATGFGDSSTAMIEKVLIRIFETLCKNYSGDPDKYLNIIKNIFENDITTKKLINGLLELYGNSNAADPQPLYFAEYNSTKLASINALPTSGNKFAYMQRILALDTNAVKTTPTVPTVTLLLNKSYTDFANFNNVKNAAQSSTEKTDAESIFNMFNEDTIRASIIAKTTSDVGTFDVIKAAIIGEISADSLLDSSTIVAIASYHLTVSGTSSVTDIKTAAVNAQRKLLTQSAVSPTTQAELDQQRNILDNAVQFGVNTPHILVLDKINNATQPYTNIININNITYNSTLYKLSLIISQFTSADINIIANKQELEGHIEKIKVLYKLLKDNNSNFNNILTSDKTSIEINGAGNFNIDDFIGTTTINTELATIKTKLKIILDDYDMAIKLNDIETKLHTIPNVIKTSIKSSNTDTDTKDVNTFKKEIKASDVIYKDNIDKYKTKNNQLNNIVKSNLYNNIFLYVTIVVLIIICLCIIYINNHKASLKTQYSIMVITFLLFYYIIYTNLTINITEDFADKRLEDATLTEIHTDIHKALLKLTNFDKEYKESLEKEKNKYANYAKSSNSKVNNLEVVLNDEFINAIKSKELVKFLILFTTICIVCFIIQTNLEDLTTTSIIFIILFIVILSIYFYNINLMTRTKHNNKYWNHRMTMK